MWHLSSDNSTKTFINKEYKHIKVKVYIEIIGNISRRIKDVAMTLYKHLLVNTSVTNFYL